MSHFIKSEIIDGKNSIVSGYMGGLIDINYAKRLINLLQTHIGNWTQDEISNHLSVKAAEENAARYKESLDKAERQQSKANGGFVYLMIDKKNGCYKIGKSKHPKTRERTLQSEAPSIELIKYYVGYTELEISLHKEFRNKQVRGEWFNLSEDDLQRLELIAGAPVFETKYEFA